MALQTMKLQPRKHILMKFLGSWLMQAMNSLPMMQTQPSDSLALRRSVSSLLMMMGFSSLSPHISASSLVTANLVSQFMSLCLMLTPFSLFVFAFQLIALNKYYITTLSSLPLALAPIGSPRQPGCLLACIVALFLASASCSPYNQNKMYGVSEQLMQRMQKRIKEKIYREMIEEQQKYKKKYRERRKDTDIAQPRFKTEHNQHQEYQFNKYEDAPKPSPFLHQESTFLPVINKRYSPSENETSDSRVNPEYRKYISRRNQRLSPRELPQRERTSASAVFQPQRAKAAKREESQEEAEQYLNECEQIINNLRLLNKRNQDKLKERQSKKEQQQKSSPKNKSFSANVFAETPEHRLNAFNAKRRSHNLKGTSLTDPYRNQQPGNSSFRAYSPFRLESPQNQFSESSDLDTRPRERANALTISVNSKPNSVGMRGKEANTREKAESQPKAKENFKRLSPIKREDEDHQEEQEQPEEQEKTGVDKRSSAKEENKRQKAIVKYLKKARLRGNLLYQKIQSKKAQPKKPEQTIPDPSNPPSNDPNSSQKLSPNSDPQRQPPSLDNGRQNLPARQ